MIVYALIAGFAFAWAVVATSLVIASNKLLDAAKDHASTWREAYLDEKNRAQATSLSEYEHWRQGRVAMPMPSPDDGAQWGYDETGLVRGRIDPTE